MCPESTNKRKKRGRTGRADHEQIRVRALSDSGPSLSLSFQFSMGGAQDMSSAVVRLSSKASISPGLGLVGRSAGDFRSCGSFKVGVGPAVGVSEVMPVYGYGFDAIDGIPKGRSFGLTKSTTHKTEGSKTPLRSGAQQVVIPVQLI
jgi:hypothetical protein